MLLRAPETRGLILTVFLNATHARQKLVEATGTSYLTQLSFEWLKYGCELGICEDHAARLQGKSSSRSASVCGRFFFSQIF